MTPATKAITYAVEPDLTSKELIDLLNRSGLAVRRPFDQPERIQRMIDQSSIMLCARADGLLVGISRSVTDFSYCCYLSDLAVDAAFHGKGIGRTLIEKTHEIAGDETLLLLLEAPMAAGYYEHVGFQKLENCWGRPRKV